MSAKTHAKLLARTTLALGWLVLGIVATSVFAENPNTQPGCGYKNVSYPCTQAGVLPPVCGFWAKGDPQIDEYVCSSKTMKTRSNLPYSYEQTADNLKGAILSPDEDYCWLEYACIYDPVANKCRKATEPSDYGTLPVYLNVTCEVKVDGAPPVVVIPKMK